MAKSPHSEIEFHCGRPDCARRVVMDLPQVLPETGNDFDWRVRDYDSFRLFMMEELAARSPDRARWSPADLEVVLVEALATVLDQLSDMSDRVAAEATLETARRPESVRRLLEFIGYDPVANALADGVIDGSLETDDRAVLVQRLEQAWAEQPRLMDKPRRAGPREMHAPRRMVTVEDYGALMEEHPLVLRANAFERWSGAWTQVRIALMCWNERPLDEEEAIPEGVVAELRDFERRRGLPETDAKEETTTYRSVLTRYADHFRMACQDVQLMDAQPAGIVLSVHVQVSPHYFQSEVRRVAEEALGRGPRGFFAPGRLQFGEDVFASDLIQTLTALDGVERVELRQLKRFGGQYLDQTTSGRIILEGLELAVCDNLPDRPERGSFTLVLSGGRRG